MELDRDRIRAIGWIAAALLVTVLAVKVVASGGSEAGSVTVDPVPAPGASTPAGGTFAVQLAGEVKRPGVYRVPPGARVHEAVARAGGFTTRADQAGVNLVAKVTDGQQVIVPRRGAAATPAQSPGVGSGPTPRVSLGSATPEQLDAIDGIGPTLATRILEYRERHGGFRSVDELRQVDGIGEKRFEALREAVTP